MQHFTLERLIKSGRQQDSSVSVILPSAQGIQVAGMDKKNCKLIRAIVPSEERDVEQRQVARSGQFYTVCNSIAQEISRHQGLNRQQFKLTPPVLEGDIVQFKLEDTTGIRWQVGNNTLIMEAVMQDRLANLVPKGELGYSEISEEEEQFKAYTSSYSIIFIDEDIVQLLPHHHLHRVRVRCGQLDGSHHADGQPYGHQVEGQGG